MGTTCIPWKVCGSGKFRVNGTSTADASCEACSVGSYQPLHAYKEQHCIPWKTCDEGQYRSNGTTLTDATCKTCPIGRYQPKNAHTKETCLPWRTCEVGEKRINGTNTSDASCIIINPFEGVQFQRYEDGSTEAVNADQPVAYPSFRAYVLDWNGIFERRLRGLQRVSKLLHMWQ